MALAKFRCTHCDKDFEAGDWFCTDGMPHTVKEKTYYVLDAPMDKRDCKNARLQMLNVIPEGKITRGTDTYIEAGTNIEFVRGLYSTDNPRIQVNLDKRAKVFHGPEGKKMWEEVYYSDSERKELEAINLRAKISRLENGNNTLLQQVQEKAKKVPVPA